MHAQSISSLARVNKPEAHCCLRVEHTYRLIAQFVEVKSTRAPNLSSWGGGARAHSGLHHSHASWPGISQYIAAPAKHSSYPSGSPEYLASHSNCTHHARGKSNEIEPRTVEVFLSESIRTVTAKGSLKLLMSIEEAQALSSGLEDALSQAYYDLSIREAE